MIESGTTIAGRHLASCIRDDENFSKLQFSFIRVASYSVGIVKALSRRNE